METKIEETKTNIQTDLKVVASKLKEIKNMYRNTLQMPYDQQERLVLEYFKLKSAKHPELTPLKHACEQVLEQYREDTPYDISLIREVWKLLDHQFGRVLPIDGFDRYMLVYKISFAAIQQIFDEIQKLELSKVDRHIVKALNRVVRNALIDNPNFKGDNPYYKRNMRDFSRSSNLSIELLDFDFDSYISYFEEENE